jgi:hypothetical protein
MKVGDLVRVLEAKGHGVCKGSIGLVIEEDNRQKTTPRWKVLWFTNTEVLPGFHLKESKTYGYGMEVISV